MSYTDDLSDGFFQSLAAVCDRLRCAPLDMLKVMMNESGVRADAKNPTADANGLIQFMGDTLRGLGWSDGSDAFRQLSAEEQVPWVEKYYAPHTGKLTSPGALYLATFMPALMQHADDTSFVIASTDGPYTWAYNANRSFDVDEKGYITVSDLTAATERAAHGSRWNEIVQRMNAVSGGEVMAYAAPGSNTGISKVAKVAAGVSVAGALGYLFYKFLGK